MLAAGQQAAGQQAADNFFPIFFIQMFVGQMSTAQCPSGKCFFTKRRGTSPEDDFITGKPFIDCWRNRDK
jgi:hypothetical protein